MDTHTNIVYSHAGYDVIINFWSEVIAKELSEIPPATALDGISPETGRLK